jgi:zinc transporter 1/2/3
MIDAFHFMSILLIVAFTLGGGYYPLFKRSAAGKVPGLPLGQAFAAGVFLALAFVGMLPSAFRLFAKVYPTIAFPIPSVLATASFLSLLAMGHIAAKRGISAYGEAVGSSAMVPVILTVMIAIPSFLLGTALGVSQGFPAFMILAAILAHKGSAAFALALAMVRSTMTQRGTYILFACFAAATPVGVAIGEDVHEHLTGYTMLVVKAVILSLAAGVFVYMATLHEMEDSPLIVQCSTVKGFLAMLCGVLITGMVVLLLSVAHTAHGG